MAFCFLKYLLHPVYIYYTHFTQSKVYKATKTQRVTECQRI